MKPKPGESTLSTRKDVGDDKYEVFIVDLVPRKVPETFWIYVILRKREGSV